ncbi:NACHT domain-containing protein [Streptomyces triticirhizae]|uniref:NACHT domain-containing protein n=1 Tax=Streptomyces triticirhizae TaxID=2483353 RepID=A0A3M2MG68_9ACTN|nr:NACHT domain-containing protein [Streptomyces triticirhizae]RMI46248.1 NACHT domain-containing protein [Streptomyces triticirhizae]
MDVASVGVRLGSGVVAPLVRRLFKNPGPGAGLVDKPVRIDELVSFRGEKRTLGEREMAKLARELVDRGLKALGTEGAALAEERPALETALAETLHGLGRLDMDDAQAVRLGADRLAETLPDRSRELSAAGEAFYRALVRLACLHIVDFFSKRSTFVARTLVEQTRQNERLIATLDLLIERLPPRSTEDGGFEDRYRRYVAGRHGTLTIFGLDRDDEWPLDDAYLSLEATRREPGHEMPVVERAERALAGLDRVLLRGGAGSGKTTLVQWLAVTTAADTVPPGLNHLLGRVPFVLPLRTLARGDRELPGPGDFLSAVNCPHTPPAGWAERVLAAGRALLLVDGIDEIPEERRPATRAWLREMLREFPGNVWLVTGRPAAVAEDWLARERFVELALAPLSPADVGALIHRWHRAARGEEAEAHALLRAVRGRQDLARLATNPLMCAVMCALHHASHGYLPRGREALYEAALRMLLERRDRQRQVTHSITLDAASATQLLQKLAYWLIRNGDSEMDRPDAVAVIDGALPSMPQVRQQGSAEDVYRHLLERSGLLREPAEGLVDFVHRTFQDYLAAREAVEARDLPLLVKNAHRDQWEDVVRMAVAHGRPEERARLLRLLVRRGDQVKRHRLRLHLLAAACLEHATQLAPEVRELVTARLTELLPPRTWNEAVALAQTGSVVLELLPGPAELTSDEERLAVFETMRLVGGDVALNRLVEFCGCGDGEVERRLALCWTNFEPGSYAETVLPRLRPGEPVLVTRAEELPHLARTRTPYTTHGFAPEQLVSAGVADRCVRLSVTDPVDLAVLGRLSALRELRLGRGVRVRDVSFLKGLGLRAIELEMSEEQPLRGLQDLDDPETLVVWAYAPLSRLPRRVPVTWLTCVENFGSLTPVREWPRLRTVAFASGLRRLRPEDWRALSAVERLETLYCWGELGENLLESGVVLTNIRQLGFHSLPPGLDLSRLADAAPRLERLGLAGGAGVDLTPLARLPGLGQVTLLETESVSGADALSGVTVRHSCSRYRSTR